MIGLLSYYVSIGASDCGNRGAGASFLRRVTASIGLSPTSLNYRRMGGSNFAIPTMLLPRTIRDLLRLGLIRFSGHFPKGGYDVLETRSSLCSSLTKSAISPTGPTWGRALHDEHLAQAIVDCVLERGRPLRLDAPSGPLDDTIKEHSVQEADLVRIFGKSRSEFPEPTFAARGPSALAVGLQFSFLVCRVVMHLAFHPAPASSFRT